MSSTPQIEPSQQSLEGMIHDLKSLLASNCRSTDADESTARQLPEDFPDEENYFTFMGSSVDDDEADSRKYASEKLHKFFNLGGVKTRPEALKSERSLSDRTDKIRRLVLSKMNKL